MKNRNTSLLIWKTFARFGSTKIYSKFDIIAAFNKTCIQERDEEKTMFDTWYSLFEYVIMPFSLCNAPKTFQSYINETLQEFLDDFYIAYLDDILIYIKSISIYTEHIQKVLSKLRIAKLFLDIWKCDFSVKKIKSLGVIINTTGPKIN